MPTERTSTGDPARTLRLLWRDTVGERDAAGGGDRADASVSADGRPAGRGGRRGPRRGLSIDAVVERATAIADAEGLEALTMRRVAEALRVAPMTLYTYVPGKAELLDLMLDAAYARMSRADTTGAPWRDRVTAIAEENRALCERHPWVAAVCTVRPPLGPGQMAKYEHELSALDGLGLDDVEMDDCLTHLLSFVQSCARAGADARAARDESAQDDRQWWAVNGPLLARVLDERAYPTAVRVGAAAGAAHGSAYDPDHAYAFGLQRVLDAFATLIDEHRAAPS